MSEVTVENRLLSRVGTIVAPERSLLGQYFLAVDSDMRRLKLALSVHVDMDQFDVVAKRPASSCRTRFDPT